MNSHFTAVRNFTCLHVRFFTQLIRLTSVSNKQLQLKQQIITEVFRASLTGLSWHNNLPACENKELRSLKYFVLQDIWGGKTLKKVSADLIFGQVQNRM